MVNEKQYRHNTPSAGNPHPDPPAAAAAVPPLTQTRAVGRWQGKEDTGGSWPVILGIKAPPEDDFWNFKDYRRYKSWQAMEKIAEKRGVKIIVTEFEYCRDTTLGFCSITDRTILINELVPNWFKPFVLAHELAHYKLHGNLDTERYVNDAYYYAAIEKEACVFAKRLYSFIKNRLPKPQLPPGYKSINTPEGWNELARRRREAIAEAA